MAYIDNLSPVFCNWFVGFTDGEGSFYISHQHNDKGTAEYCPRFGISLIASDIETLQNIQRQLGFGTVGITHTRHKPFAYFRTNKLEELLALIKVFDRYPLQSKKQKDYEIWKLAVLERNKRKDLDKALMIHYFNTLKQLHHNNEGTLLDKQLELLLKRSNV